MGKEDYGPISQYNSLTDPYLQGYFSKNIIRNHLRQSGLISRKGDIIPEEVWRKRIATEEKMQQASRLIASKIVQQAIELKNFEKAEFRRKLDDVAKKELVRRIRGQSAQTRELPLLWPGNRGYSEERLRTRSRSPKAYDEVEFYEDSQSFINDRHRQYRRTGHKLGSKRLSSKKRLTKLNRGYALLPKPEPIPVMVTMYYYGKSLNIPFDTQVFEYRDEISIYQQHCGGENLLVYSGLHQAGDKFEFRSKRHKEYPFSLTIYINSTYDCRISTCCEYKHQLNIKIGGKGGRFAITNVTGSEPCIKCLLDKSEKEAKRRREREAKQKEEETKVDDIKVDTQSPVNSRKNSDQEVTEIEVKHEEDIDKNYEDEWQKSDNDDKVDSSKSESESSKSESETSSHSDKEPSEEIKKTVIQVKHEEDEVTDETINSNNSKRKSTSPADAVTEENKIEEKPTRYSSNDLIDIIEKEVDTIRAGSKASKKSSGDNTSEDESKLDLFEDKAKSPKKKGSKSSSRTGSRKSELSSSSSDNDSIFEDQNDSDTEKLLNRIKSGRTKQASPNKSKTPSQVGSRNSTPSKSVAKSPSPKPVKDSSKPNSPLLKENYESEKQSRIGSPVESKTPSQKGSRNSSPARSATKSPSLKSPKGSRQPSPTKNASKPSSPTHSRKSSSRSEKSLKDESRDKKSPSPSKSLASPKAKSPVQKESNSFSSSTDESSDLTNEQRKGEAVELKEKLSEILENVTNNLVDDTNTRSSPTKNSNTSPGLVKSADGSRQSLKQADQRPDSSASKQSEGSNKPLNRTGSADSKNERNDKRAESSASHKSEQKRDSPKKLSRAGSAESKKSSRPSSENKNCDDYGKERAESSASKKSSRRSSKNSLSAEKPRVPEVNIIPSSDVEKNSNASFNDETKWYKDDGNVQS